MSSVNIIGGRSAGSSTGIASAIQFTFILLEQRRVFALLSGTVAAFVSIKTDAGLRASQFSIAEFVQVETLSTFGALKHFGRLGILVLLAQLGKRHLR